MVHTVNEFANRSTPQTHHFEHYESISKELLNYVKSELRQRGANTYDLWLPETKFLPRVLHKDEHIMGSVYGRYNNRLSRQGRGVLVATDQRVLFMDKKPLFMHLDEISFAIIGGISFTRSLSACYVTLHTRLGDYVLLTFNFKNAANFVDFIETKCLQNAEPGARY